MYTLKCFKTPQKVPLDLEYIVDIKRLDMDDEIESYMATYSRQKSLILQIRAALVYQGCMEVVSWDDLDVVFVANPWTFTPTVFVSTKGRLSCGFDNDKITSHFFLYGIPELNTGEDE